MSSNPFINDDNLELIEAGTAKYVQPAQAIGSTYTHPINGKQMKYQYNFYRTTEAAKGFGVINQGTKYNRVHKYRSVRMNAHTFVHNVALKMNRFPDTNDAPIYEDTIGTPMPDAVVDLVWDGTNGQYELPGTFFDDPNVDKYFIVDGNNIKKWSNDGGPVTNIALETSGAFASGDVQTDALNELAPSIAIDGISGEDGLITALNPA